MDTDYDGPTLRSVRESCGIPLRRVARLASMSHGHLSKVERGEHGRPVTPSILAAYEKATGVRLTGPNVVGFSDGSADSDGWRRGQLSDARRRGFNSTVGSLAAGGPLGEPMNRVLDALGRMTAPERMTANDVTVVKRAALLATVLDLQCAGGTSAQLARTVLRWSVGLMNAPMGRDLAVGLAEAVGCLAHRAAWASFDAGHHDAARHLFTVALDAAVRAGDRDLRGYVLADISAQHNYLGYPNDAVELIGLAEGDPRICHAVRMALAGVKARSHAAMGDREYVRRYLDLVDESHVRAGEVRFDDWRDTVATAGQMLAVTGHAAAMLARSSLDDADRTYAVDRLSAAVDKLDPVSHTRAYGLCLLRLAALHVGADPDMALSYAKQALGLPEGLALRSERFSRAVGVLRAAAAANGDATSAGIVELIDQQSIRDSESADGDGSEDDVPGLSDASW